LPPKEESMLDTTTRKRIDDCRDILVGKLPDPKSQIEQITIGLIYKFMDDMDKGAIDLGGVPKFFSGDFEKFSWDNIFDAKVTATEMLKLYSEAVESMEMNPNIPQLFRDIFKNAYLPYRDPETLKLFLKTIGEFEYTHSEKLGDAFEYLLSVMGSQGDAGQFRTPRHIIDFLVEAVDPSKTDTVLDPACGTAGFLISAFKRIKKKNNNELSPDERKKLIRNFMGYDISPDMVRLSLVNLYLHGFSDPHIVEYDTLTTEERWNDNFDVILANPPFMSPKGGIRPHKNFTVTSSRSEVLFVDYIAEHLNPNGRAGIIVPEGVIFQSGKAYKELRKMLVEKYLYAVVSLPAGVFNPYSGVKTSILLMDKAIALKTNKILFVKIDNDGYNLGAQRNVIKGGQLNEAIDVLNNFKESIQNRTDVENTSLAHAVEKSKIVESGEYNLSGERYKGIQPLNSTFEMVSLSNEKIFTIASGGTPSSSTEHYWNGAINWATLKDLPANQSISIVESTIRKITEEGLNNSSARLLPIDSILVSTRATIGRIAINKVACSTNQGFKNIIINNYEKANSTFVAWMMTNLIDKMQSIATGGTFKELSTSIFKTLEIPLPPLSIQEEIVAEIEGYQKILNGAKMVVENYKPNIDIDSNWEIVELSKLCDVRDGTHDSPKYKEEGFPLITSKNIKGGGINFDNVNLISQEDLDSINKRSYVDDGDIIMPMIGTIGNPIVVNKDREFAIKNVALIKFLPDSKIDRYYLKIILDSDYFAQYYQNQSSGSTQKFVSLKFLRSMKIPLAPLADQKHLVSEIDKEQTSVDANKYLIETFEKKIKDCIAKVWGE
jgi:type I restriction enzyme M protein